MLHLVLSILHFSALTSFFVDWYCMYIVHVYWSWILSSPYVQVASQSQYYMYMYMCIIINSTSHLIVVLVYVHPGEKDCINMWPVARTLTDTMRISADICDRIWENPPYGIFSEN